MTLSNVCTGKINVISCYESYETCSMESTISNHRCDNCLISSQYYTLFETKDNEFKNCYNSIAILNLPSGYYLIMDIGINVILNVKNVLH